MPKDRQPWPMKWIVLAILLAVVPYTFVTFRYRKPGPAFQPYEDMKNRANVSRLLSAGYQRVPLPARQPADGTRTLAGAVVTPVQGGIPSELRSTLVEAPTLPAEIIQVSAAPTANTLQEYALEFTCALPNDQQQLSGADLYLRGYDVVLVPTFERVTGNLLTRSRRTVVLVTIPAGTIRPGKYHVTVLGEKTSRRWPLEVK
jgi:hypothetical protein